MSDVVKTKSKPLPPVPNAAPVSVPAEPARKPIIEVVGVNKMFKVGKNIIPVLKDVNVKLYPEEFVLLLGPSGSGKSTLLNTMLGLEIPTSGKVMLQGVDITKKKMNEMARYRHKVFGIVFQKSDWVRCVNVIENVALPLAIEGRPRKERMPKAWARLKEMGMDDHAHYIPSELSGGQQQKVSLARALINDPPVIVADEPTGNLDSVSADKVMRFFKELNEKYHKTILMVTHNIEYVSYASRTIYVKDGVITEGMS